MELKSEKSMIEIIKYSLCAIYRLYVKNQSELNIYILSYFTYLNLFPIILCLFIGKLLPKCHFFSCRPRTFFKGPGFQNACENGKHLDKTTSGGTNLSSSSKFDLF